MRYACFAFLISTLAMSADLQTIPLQPPGTSAYKPGAEHDATTAKDGKPGGRSVVRLADVSDPTLTFYPAAAGANTGAAVLVFPGGGYRILAWDLEGSEICEWLNSIGVNAALVKYRVPEAPDVPRYQAPLEDAKHALALMRARASDWHFDPHKIGVIGFSAGGHLAALLSNSDMRPDFTILIYPAYLTQEKDLTVMANEFTCDGADAAHVSCADGRRPGPCGEQPGVLRGTEKEQSAGRDAHFCHGRTWLRLAKDGRTCDTVAEASGRLAACARVDLRRARKAGTASVPFAFISK